MSPPLFVLAATRRGALLLAIITATLITACKSPSATSTKTTSTTTPPAIEFRALYTPHSIAITGSLDDPIWSQTPTYPMNAMNDDQGHRMSLKEGGKVRFAWDNKFLYLAVDFTDSDVRTKADQDGLHAYKLGDVCELFLKPVGQSSYWELYALPNGHQTTFLWPAPGQRPRDALQKINRLIVAAHVNGTLNDDQDHDQGWTAQMAVPWDMLKFHDQQFGPQTGWHVLVGRYNYSAYLLDSPEYSSAPAISKTSYHLTEEYAPLVLQGK
jgi:hypothetical protein